MRVHFIGALEGNKRDYQTILALLRQHGCALVTNHSITRSIAAVKRETPAQAVQYATRMRMWIAQADVVVVEATYSGFGTGFEIATAIAMKKPVIVLYQQSVHNTPYVLQGIVSETVQLLQYTPATLVEKLRAALDYVKESAEIRAKVAIPHALKDYVRWLSEHSDVSESAVMRGLIAWQMAHDARYHPKLSGRKRHLG